jgi:hypothetical protein
MYTEHLPAIKPHQAGLARNLTDAGKPTIRLFFEVE